jgi:hypothetical protein
MNNSITFDNLILSGVTTVPTPTAPPWDDRTAGGWDASGWWGEPQDNQVWDGSKWTLDPAEAHHRFSPWGAGPEGDWNNNYRPTHLRVIYTTNGPNFEFTMKNLLTDVMISGQYASGESIPITYLSGLDFYYFKMDEDTFTEATVTKIEFLP